MKDNLKQDIANIICGYTVDHIVDVLTGVLAEVSPKATMKPCPSCGKPGHIISHHNKGVTTSMFGFCRDCGYRSQSTLVSDVPYSSEAMRAAAIAIWNKSIPADPDMHSCLVCNSPQTYIHADYDNSGNITSAHVVCRNCGFRSRKAERTSTDTLDSLRRRAIDIWNNSRQSSLFAAAERAFGREYQLVLIDEETFELISVLTTLGTHTSRTKRPDRPVPTDDILAEMADVIISTYQWLYSKNIPFHQLDQAVSKKLTSLCTTEPVRSAALKLSRKITEETTINVPSVDESSKKDN